MGCSGSKVNDARNSINVSKQTEDQYSEINITSRKRNSNKANNLRMIYNPDNYESHYDIIEKLGKGAFGSVYKVIHKVTGKIRALKIINESFIKFQDDEKEFLKEIELLANLDHPSIIKVFEYFYKNKNFYVIQEYCKGGELYEEIYQIESFTEKDAAIIMYQLLSAICYLHSNNIVHRDLKPENIMLENKAIGDYSIKLIDFGTANYCSNDKYLTQKVGTLYYISPEVLMKKYNKTCDIWSCGVILFILLSGYPPFDGDTDEDITNSILNEELDFEEEEEWKNISKKGIDFLKKLLQKDPKKRISAQQCLNEEWLLSFKNKITLNQMNISNQVQNFQKFDSKQKLKNAIVAFMVHHIATEEMTKELKTLFKKMDKSGDGRLSSEEIKEGFRELYTSQQTRDVVFVSDVELERRFKLMDMDKSGFIEIEEFLTVMINQELLLNDQNLKTTFDYFDKDRSGQLDSNEIEVLLNIKNTGDHKQLVKELITKYDTNDDGVLSFDEFKELIKNFNLNISIQ